jgi:hypothetical protein
MRTNTNAAFTRGGVRQDVTDCGSGPALNSETTRPAQPGLRHYCRNRHCRSKLKQPVENHHHAFCTRGCFESFYRNRCRVCERDLRKQGRRGDAGRLYCRPPNRCGHEGRKWPHKYGYPSIPHPHAIQTSKVPILRASKPAPRGDRASFFGPADWPISVMNGRIGGPRSQIPDRKLPLHLSREIFLAEGLPDRAPKKKVERKWSYAEWLAVVTDPDWVENEPGGTATDDYTSFDPVPELLLGAHAKIKTNRGGADYLDPGDIPDFLRRCL